jgi:hypothetical protein
MQPRLGLFLVQMQMLGGVRQALAIRYPWGLACGLINAELQLSLHSTSPHREPGRHPSRQAAFGSRGLLTVFPHSSPASAVCIDGALGAPDLRCWLADRLHYARSVIRAVRRPSGWQTGRLTPLFRRRMSGRGVRKGRQQLVAAHAAARPNVSTCYASAPIEGGMTGAEEGLQRPTATSLT